MTEERYLKISSCKECPHHGHTSYAKLNKGITIFICGFPENMVLKQLPAEEMNGIFYPIIHESKFSENIPIPFWCKLANIAYNEQL